MSDDCDLAQQVDDASLDQQVRAFVECRDLIQGHISALVRDPALAEDVFQEVWLRFEGVTRRGEVIANVPKWCRAAARLVAMESWREQRREQATPDSELVELVERAYSEQDGRDEFWQLKAEALRQCMDALPKRSRDLLARRYFSGNSISALASQLGQSIGSVKTALCRLRLALSDCANKRLASRGVL
jgi:RNA polymerase sigma-70 factor, ECF subfamily